MGGGLFDHIIYWGVGVGGESGHHKGRGDKKTSPNRQFVRSFRAQRTQISTHSYFRASWESMKAFGRMELNSAKSLTAVLSVANSDANPLDFSISLALREKKNPFSPLLRSPVGPCCIFPVRFDPSVLVRVGICKPWPGTGVTSGASMLQKCWHSVKGSGLRSSSQS